jgi:peptidoglycan hydrolase-like protein with peptidoglycan-binding domain
MKKLSTAILSLGLLVVFGVPTFSHALPNPNVADVDPNGDTASNSCVTLSSTGLRYRATDYVTGGEVSLLQDFLISKGFLSGQPTGFFGSMTFSAVKNFQKSVGFSPTGYVGNLTKAKIKELSCGGAAVLPVDTNTTNVVSNAMPYIKLVAGMAADNGEIDAGGKVGIQGTNLSGYKDATNVYIGGKVCAITQLGNDLIYCTAPSDLVVGSTYDLYINTAGMSGDKITSNVVKVKVLSRVSKTSVTPPYITDISPASGPFNSRVTITGLGFLSMKNIVTFSCPDVSGGTGGGGPTNLYSADGRTLTLSVPTMPVLVGSPTTNYPRTCNVSVTNENGKSNSVSFSITTSTTIPQPSITVLSPNGGEILQAGQIYNIKWNSQGLGASKVNIELWTLGSSVIENSIATNAYNSGSFVWSVPKITTNLSSYFIIIRSVDSNLGTTRETVGRSAGLFTITPPQTIVPSVSSLTVLTPVNPTTHGDTFSTGETVPLAWSSKEFGVNRIYLLSETGDKVATILATNDNGVFPYTGSTYSWKISDNIPTGTYKVRVIIGIEGLSTSPVGDSGTFRIRNTVSSNLPIQTPTRIINVYSPQGGEQLAAGQVYRIRWNNSVGVDKVSINLKGEDGTVLTIAELSNNPNFYDWTPTTALAGSKYKIEVVEGSNAGSTSRAASVSGVSANYFLVTGGSTTALPSIHLLQPIGGETFTAPGKSN